MKWLPYPEQKPTISKTYIASIQRPYSNGSFTFSYIAHYDADTDRWHKLDNFDDDSIKEVIEERIVGWSNDLTTTYLGAV